jgi:TolA-binding protein
MKYLFIILTLASCGQSEKAYIVNTPVTDTKVIDSINLVADSVTNALADLPEYINSVKARISKLEKEKKTLQEQINEPQVQALTDYRSDDRDKVIAQLRKSLYEKETEIATLKKKITTDSVYRSRPYIGQKLIEQDVMKPDDKSLVITLDKKMRGDGEIAETGITVYIMKYTKEVRKKFKEYGTCNLADINSVGAVEASYYEGQYFFNGIEPGKYLIKVCSLFGNYMVINREDSYQKIEMKVSPPIQ